MIPEQRRRGHFPPIHLVRTEPQKDPITLGEAACVAGIALFIAAVVGGWITAGVIVAHFVWKFW